MKKIILFLFTILFLISCTSKPVIVEEEPTITYDGKQYLEALLDARLNGKYVKYIETTKQTFAIAQEYHDSWLRHDVDSFLFIFDAEISDENYEKAKQFYLELYKHFDYEIISISKEENIETLEITIRPIMHFIDTESITDEYASKFLNDISNIDKYSDYNDVMNGFLSGLLDIYIENIPNIRLGEPEVITIQVEYIEQKSSYYIKTEDYYSIENAFIKSEQ